MLLKRRAPAHPPIVERHNQPIIIFLTVCTAGRKPVLANVVATQLLRNAWTMDDEWTVGRYVIMPDHIHLFCAPAGLGACSLVKWISYWKFLVSKQWPQRTDLPLWQRDHWDRQLRQQDSYGDKWEYVRLNPVRHGLVKRPGDWSYQGEMNVLMW